MTEKVRMRIMKNRFRIKLLSKMISFLLILILTVIPVMAEEAAVEQDEKAHMIEARIYPYLRAFSDEEEVVEDEMTLYFIDGSEVPYMTLTQYMSFLSNLLSDMEIGDIIYEVSETEEHVYTVSRPDNYSMLFVNTDNDTMTFSDYNLFTQVPGTTALVSILDLPEPGFDDLEAMPEPEENENELFRIRHRSINRAGGRITLELSAYMIDMVDENGECYIPMQTLNDLLLNQFYMQYVFNGETVFGAGYGCSLLRKMYEAEPCEMSLQLAVFNYTELLLLLDCFYGLKPEHNINSFVELLTSDTDLAYEMMSTDPEKFDSAVHSLTSMYLDDLHSGYIMSSWRSGEDDHLSTQLMPEDMGPSSLAMQKAGNIFSEARKAVYQKGVPGYEEIDDTAFITFDTFTMERSAPADYYDYFDGTPADTIELRDTFTGAETIIDYQADVNLDDQFDSMTDSLIDGGYHVYCLTSPKSFSCGNLVPAACKASREVTLVGQTSSGGSCVILPCTSASGTVFRISGNKQLSIVRNGSFYNIDKGIDPDIELTKPESFYDRPALVDYLHRIK